MLEQSCVFEASVVEGPTVLVCFAAKGQAGEGRAGILAQVILNLCAQGSPPPRSREASYADRVGQEERFWSLAN